MADRPRSADDLPLGWVGQGVQPHSDPAITEVALNQSTPTAFDAAADPGRRRGRKPSAFAEAEGPRVQVDLLNPNDGAPPPCSGRIKLRR